MHISTSSHERVNNSRTWGNRFQELFLSPQPAHSIFENCFVFLLLVSVFTPLSLGRLVAQDEGFYALAARLTSEGHLPYRDFFYPQMPLLPLLYGAWMRIWGVGFGSGRILSALLTAGCGLIVYLYVLRACTRATAIIAVLLFLLSGWIFPWFLLVKNYAAPVFLSLIALYALRWHKESLPRSSLIIAGAALALATAGRLYFAALIPLAFCQIVISARSRFRSSSWFLGGILLGSFPIIYFIVLDFDLFWFNNIGYHLDRSALESTRKWIDKVSILSRLIGIRRSDQIVGYDFLLLFILAILSITANLRDPRKLDSSLLTVVVLALVSVIPSPIYLQYFSVLVPSLIIFVTIGSWDLLHPRSVGFQATSVISIIVAGAFILYMQSFPTQVTRFTKTGAGVIGVNNSEEAQRWTLKSAEEITQAVVRIQGPGEKVLALWPGYLLHSALSPFPNTENQFGVRAARVLKVLESDYYRVTSSTKLRAEILSGSPDIIVAGKELSALKLRERDLVAAGYNLTRKMHKVKIYRKGS